MDKRPRRNIIQKKSDYNEGLLWQEERDLTRALYKSLQRQKSDQDAPGAKEQQNNLESTNTTSSSEEPQKTGPLKLEPLKPVLQNSEPAKPNSPKTLAPKTSSPKSETPTQDSPKSEQSPPDSSASSIAHRLRASSLGSHSRSIMGSILHPAKPPEIPTKSNAAIAVSKGAGVPSDKCKMSVPLSPPPPPPLPPPPPPPPLQPAPRLNAAAHRTRTLPKRPLRTVGSVRQKDTHVEPPAKAVAGNAKRPKTITLLPRPTHHEQKELRSRSSRNSSIRRETRSSTMATVATRSRSSSSNSRATTSSGTSNSESQDEATSSSSPEPRKPKPRKAKQRPVELRVKSGPLKRCHAPPVSSTSGEELEEELPGSKPKKSKLQAQRKFAHPQAYSPGCTPSKTQNGVGMMPGSRSSILFNHCPSTEDFLTFLCLRGTPALPPHLDLFKVEGQPTATKGPSNDKHPPGQRRNGNLVTDGEIRIPGIEPLPADDSPAPVAKTNPPPSKAPPSFMEQKQKISERRRRLDARQFKASGKLSRNLQLALPSNQKDLLGNPQPLPPSLTPVPPPIIAVPHNTHPPPLIPIVPWENKRCHANGKGILQQRGKANVKLKLARSSGNAQCSGRNNCVPSTLNHRLTAKDQTPTTATTSKPKNRKRKEVHNHTQKREKRGRKLIKEQAEKRINSLLDGSNHLLDHKLDDVHDRHTFLNQIKMMKGTRRERKEKRCTCHTQNCGVAQTRRKHRNGRRQSAVEGAIEEVLKTAKREKKLKELKRQSSRKLRNSPMILRHKVEDDAVELDSALRGKKETVSSILASNGISRKLTIPLTNCTLNNNVLRKDGMICPKSHLNHEIEKRLTELKIQEDEEAQQVEIDTKSRKYRNSVISKNNKEPQLLGFNSPNDPQQKPAKPTQSQSSPRRSRTKNGPSAVKSSSSEPPAEPNKFLENVKEGLVLRPSAEEWSNPLAYVDSIAEQLSSHGMCRVIPPEGWKPECKLNVNTRFTTEVQYIHRLRHRWKSRSKQLACIKRHLEEKEKVAYNPPQICGCEIDLVQFSEIVSQQGGLKTINSNKRWNKVADLLHIPKTFQSRVSKLDSVYCKYLLSYDTLSKEEKQRLEVETEEFRKHQIASRLRSQDDAYNRSEEIVCKGRPTTLANFCRMATVDHQMHCRKNGATVDNIEEDYWKMLDTGEPHVAVHTGQLNAALSARHSWNTKNIGKNPDNLLHLLPSRLKVNMPELKLSMLYSTEAWSVDSRALLQAEYLHTGSAKIWYGVPASHCNSLENVLQSEVPELCTNQPHCLYKHNLNCMVPPSVLTSKGLPVYRLVQKPGEFIITASGAATASISTGYNIVEGIPFASPAWLQNGLKAFEICRELKQSSLFSLDHLVCLLANAATDQSNPQLLRELLTELKIIRDRELSLRQELFTAGIKSSICFAESVTSEDTQSMQAGNKTKNHASEKGCYICNQLCYLSMVVNEREDRVYCLQHALQMISKTKLSGRNFKLLYRYSENQLRELVERIEGSNNHVSLATSPATSSSPQTSSSTASTAAQDKSATSIAITGTPTSTSTTTTSPESRLRKKSER